ncbi:hypothetical protein TeGR_g9483 [Tetraparma gracilis]|uniref:Uncharacterized protein n=1 Tax=Tetraparma gracilis TaxID=2962635 RepID=A0ABQ6MI57_9STRA|nr:hypothetical protein TeGR_g9483 [Tetraparma gracilis]
MNNVASATVGWASFTFAVLGGAYVGYSQFKDQNAENLAVNEDLVRDRNRRLREMGERMKKDAGGGEGGGRGGGKKEKEEVEQVMFSSHEGRDAGQKDVRKYSYGRAE